jgi:hypothetical protein
MADDQNKQDQSQGAGAAQNTDAGADLQRLKEVEARYNKLLEAAKEAEFDDPESYIDALEQTAYEAYKSKQDGATDNNAGNQPDGNQPPGPAQSAAPATGLTEAQIRQLNESANASAKAWMQSQWVELLTLTPDADRAQLVQDRAALTRLISGPKAPFIAEMAQKEAEFGGNIFAAARSVLNMQSAAQQNRAASAAAAAAKDAAASSTGVSTGTGGSDPSDNLTPQQKAQKDSEDYAKRVAPDTPYAYEER